MQVSAAQFRAARAGLDLTQRQIATAAGIHARTVKMIERDRVKPQRATYTRLVGAYRAAGVQFAGDGVTLRLSQPGQ